MRELFDAIRALFTREPEPKPAPEPERRPRPLVPPIPFERASDETPLGAIVRRRTNLRWSS